MSDRKYIVRCKRGMVEVIVRIGAIELRGEHEAVAQAAWLKLLGKNELGEDVDKNSATRRELMTIIFSTYTPYREGVYEKFKASIKFTWVGVEHAVR